jgi:hypothetical protein
MKTTFGLIALLLAGVVGCGTAEVQETVTVNAPTHEWTFDTSTFAPTVVIGEFLLVTDAAGNDGCHLIVDAGQSSANGGSILITDPKETLVSETLPEAAHVSVVKDCP